jgi:hypothetical protein
VTINSPKDRLVHRPPEVSGTWLSGSPSTPAAPSACYATVSVSVLAVAQLAVALHTRDPQCLVQAAEHGDSSSWLRVDDPRLHALHLAGTVVVPGYTRPSMRRETAIADKLTVASWSASSLTEDGSNSRRHCCRKLSNSSSIPPPSYLAQVHL